MQKIKFCGAAVVVAALLSGCGGGGGGGGDSTTPTPTPTPTPAATPLDMPFALAAGYQGRIASGASNTFDLSGTCTGTASITTDPATAATFEGVNGYSAAQVSTVNFVNCSPASSSSNGSTYYSAGYVPIGLAIVGGEYSRFASAPSALPSTVKVGDSGELSTMTTYADSTKATVTGKRVVSYVIEHGTATTAIANVITRSYDVSNNLLATQQSRFHMAGDGTLTYASIEVQFSTTSNVRLLYTPR